MRRNVVKIGDKFKRGIKHYIKETLDCGHVLDVLSHNKIVGKRNCKECEFIKDGTDRIINGVMHTWDDEKKMPVPVNG